MEKIYDFLYYLGMIPLLVTGIYNLIYPKLKPHNILFLSLLLTAGCLAGIKYSFFFTIVSIIIIFFYLYYLYHDLIVLLALPLSYIISAIFLNIISLLFYNILNINYQTLIHTPISFFCYICDLTVIFIITYIIGKIFYKRLFHNTFKLSKRLISALLLNFLLCCTLILANILAGEKVGYQTDDVIFNVILFIIFFILSCIILVHSIKNEQSAVEAKERLKQYEHLKEYTENLEESYNHLRAFKHDYVNIITSISSYLEEKQYDGLTDYFYQHIAPTKKELEQNNESLNKLMHIKQLEIKSLISYKLMKALELGIEVSVDIPNDIYTFSMDPIDLTRILGIYLDNATEAARESNTPKLELHIANLGDRTAILLSNTFFDHGLSVTDMIKLHTTTKGDGHGIGLSNVNKILENYPTVFQEILIKESFFIQHLELPNA